MIMDRRIEILNDIIIDSEADVSRFEGALFTGKSVAEYMGCQAAMIQALARVMKSMIEMDKKNASD